MFMEKFFAALSPERRAQLEDREADKQYPVSQRRHDRAVVRARETRRRKGQRRFFEQQRKGAYARQTLAAQLEILAEYDDTNPLHRNVLHGLQAKYGDQIDAMIAAEKIA